MTFLIFLSIGLSVASIAAVVKLGIRDEDELNLEQLEKMLFKLDYDVHQKLEWELSRLKRQVVLEDHFTYQLERMECNVERNVEEHVDKVYEELSDVRETIGAILDYYGLEISLNNEPVNKYIVKKKAKQK